MDVGSFDFLQIIVQHLGHGATGDIRAFLGQATVSEIAAGMLAVGHVHITDDVNDAAIGLLGEAFIFAAVACFHVENRDMEALGADDAETAIGVAQDEHGIGFDFHHKLVALGDDVAHGLAQVVAHSVHVDLRVGEFQVLEEDAVEVVVVVLAGMCQDAVEVLSALVDDRCESNDFRSSSYNNEEL